MPAKNVFKSRQHKYRKSLEKIDFARISVRLSSFPGNLQISNLATQPIVDKNHCTAGITWVLIVANERSSEHESARSNAVFPLGAVCGLDHNPRRLNESQKSFACVNSTSRNQATLVTDLRQ